MVSDSVKEFVVGMAQSYGKIANQTPGEAFSKLARLNSELSGFAYWYYSASSIDPSKVEGPAQPLILAVFNNGKNKKDICILLGLVIEEIAKELLKVSEKMEE